MWTEPRPDGLTAVQRVDVGHENCWAEDVPNTMALTDVKLRPVIVTLVPPRRRPVAGLTPVIVGGNGGTGMVVVAGTVVVVAGTVVVVARIVVVVVGRTVVVVVTGIVVVVVGIVEVVVAGIVEVVVAGTVVVVVAGIVVVVVGCTGIVVVVVATPVPLASMT